MHMYKYVSLFKANIKRVKYCEVVKTKHTSWNTQLGIWPRISISLETT